MTPQQIAATPTDRTPAAGPLEQAAAPRLWWYPYGHPELAERMY